MSSRQISVPSTRMRTGILNRYGTRVRNREIATESIINNKNIIDPATRLVVRVVDKASKGAMASHCIELYSPWLNLERIIYNLEAILDLSSSLIDLHPINIIFREISL